MTITLESTTRLVEINGMPARVWEGQTDTGIPITALLTRIAVQESEDQQQFERELVSCRPPSNVAIEAFPLRMLL